MTLLSGVYVTATHKFEGIWAYVLACLHIEGDERIFMTLMTVNVLFFFSWPLENFNAVITVKRIIFTSQNSKYK
jgi:hypothetical protein